MTDILIVTFLAIVLDVVTGVAGAVKTGTVKSGKMREGLWHKAGFLGVVAMAYLFEYGASVADLGISIPATSAVCIWVIVTEAVSILENLCILNPQIAKSPLGKIFHNRTEEE